MTDIYTWVALALNPVTGVVTWFASRHTRKNDTIKQMQETIDMLVKKDAELVEEVTALRTQIAELESKILKQNATIESLMNENVELKKKLSRKPTKKNV